MESNPGFNFLVALLLLIKLPNLKSYEWPMDRKCAYTFHIWHPETDVLQKMNDLSLKWTNISTYIDKEFLHLKNDALVELKQCQNWTSRLERDISSLKLQEVKGKIKQRDLNSGISHFQHQLEEMNKRITHIQRKFSKISRRHNNQNQGIDERVQKAMPLIDKSDKNDASVAEILQDSVGDMKAEWLLMKRDLIDLMNEMAGIKMKQDQFLKQTMKITQTVGNITEAIPTNRTLLHIISNEIRTVETNLGGLQEDLADIKHRESNTARDILNIQNGFKEVLIQSENMKKKLDILTTENNYQRRLLLSAGKSSNGDWQGKVETANVKLDINDVATDCQDIYNSGYRTSGKYQIKPTGAEQPDDVYCEFVNNTAYTLVQRRTDGLLRFDRLWLEYKYGFGNLYGEHWLGNELIHFLSAQRKNVLRIDLWDWEGKRFYAEYHIFSIDGAGDKYTLHVGEYKGNAGDSLSNHNDMMFSTEDMDNDQTSRNCATDYKGGWWFNSCFACNLNGVYHVGYYSHKQSAFSDGVVWYTLKDSDKYSLRKTEMKIRRLEK